MATIFDKAIEVVKNSKKFIIITHINPEGDALGSLFGTALALKTMGKEVVVYTEVPIPNPFEFLPGVDLVVHSFDGVTDIDATIAVDCGQLSRLGDDFVNFKEPGVIINMDHHPTNSNFGDINIVVPEASAAGEIVYDFLVEAGIAVDKDIATNLYIAIHTDTGGFKYSSSTAAAFRKAGELVTLGADPWDISMRVYENYPVEKFRLLGQILNTIDLSSNDKVATVKVSLEMLKSVGDDGGKDLSDGAVNYARSIRGVEVGLLLRECEDGSYKISMRSKSEVDVACVAEHFGGGGHINAAGARVEGIFEDVKARVLGELAKQLN
ncbi:MAG: bifunctional oligoribonuclease/PAP phosphatase NrnA [Deltaproteobacteria bacterium]|nr:bifunctional oligoribonuclease/PAP phosphatase NrnA [Deltaproteobacteria bacterium]